MIHWADLAGVDANVASRLISEARSIAPGIDSLEGAARDEAIELLLGVAAEVPAAGTRRIRSQSRNGTSVTWAGDGSVFSAGERAALRALCAAGSLPPGSPAFSFPPSTITQGIWPTERAR